MYDNVHTNLGGFSMEFGEFISQKRKEKNFTIRELASKLNISFTYLSDVEKGRAKAFRPEILKLLINVLQLTKEEQDKLNDLAGESQNTVAPDIAEYLKAYDYVKEFGEGVDRMCRELSAVGIKEPQYHLVAFIMKATVWANELEKGQENFSGDQIEGETTQKNYPEKLPRKTTQKISDIQVRIVDFLRNNPMASRGSIAVYINDITEDGIKYHLKALQDKGIIKRIGPDKGGYWKVLSDATNT